MSISLMATREVQVGEVRHTARGASGRGVRTLHRNERSN